jgi:hypothetical protein
MRAVEDDESVRNNLSAAAHLIHGSSEGRFSITYCAGGFEREAIESVGYGYAPLEEMLKRYDPTTLAEGSQRMDDGEEIFFIPRPGSGLWADRRLFA